MDQTSTLEIDISFEYQREPFLSHIHKDISQHTSDYVDIQRQRQVDIMHGGRSLTHFHANIETPNIFGGLT